MKPKSMEELEGYISINIENKIRNIDKKLLKLSHTPYMILVAVFIFTIISYRFSENMGSSSIILFIGILMFSVDQINVQRTDLLKELFQLKYEK